MLAGPESFIAGRLTARKVEFPHDCIAHLTHRFDRIIGSVEQERPRVLEQMIERRDGAPQRVLVSRVHSSSPVGLSLNRMPGVLGHNNPGTEGLTSNIGGAAPSRCTKPN